MLYADDRRIGEHGIGRFTRQVLANIEYRRVPLATDPDSPLDPLRLTGALSKLGPDDVFFSPGYNPPLYCSCPFLITLHDLNHLDRPENSSALKRLYYAAIVKRACRQAVFVLTVSEFSRRRIVEWSGISPDKVVNVSSGVGPEYNPSVPSYSLPFPYILCVSNRQKHKNDIRQIEAFAKSGLSNEIHLVITGNATDELMKCAETNDVGPYVHFMGKVPDPQMPSLYRGAEALLFVSLYEGFGLPLVEAMACGTPVVTSNTTSLPEIAGDAALLVDPTSIDDIAAALRLIAHDSQQRSTLRSKGLIRSAQYTWANTAFLVHETIKRSTLATATDKC